MANGITHFNTDKGGLSMKKYCAIIYVIVFSVILYQLKIC